MGAKELFAELEDFSRPITPADLTGDALDTWNAFVREARLGKWARVPRVKIFETLKKHTPLSCSLSSFRWHLHHALQEPTDGKSQIPAETEVKTKARGRRRAAG